MFSDQEEEDDVSFYIQKTEPNVLKPVSALKSFGNPAEERTKTDREPATPTPDKDQYVHEPRIRRPSIVIREHQLQQYPINYDPSPIIIRKKAEEGQQPVVYKQQIAVRYLCPPTPPPPAPLIIREIRPPQPSPLPPIIIRQQPPPPTTPPPIIIREKPPTPPSYTEPQIIYKRISPVQQATRRVIIERLPPMPSKPPNIIVERWLPYKQQKRQVIYEKALPSMEKLPSTDDKKLQNNVAIQYANPFVRIEKQVRSFSTISSNPFDQEPKLYQNLSKIDIEPVYHNFSQLLINHRNQMLK